MPARMEVIDVDANGDPIGASSGPDVDQQRSYEDFRASLKGAEDGFLVWVFKAPEDRDGNAIRAGRLEHMFTCAVDQYTLDQIADVVRNEWMEGQDKRWLIRVQIREGTTIRTNQLVSVRKSGRDQPQTQSAFSEAMKETRRMMADMAARQDALMQRILERDRVSAQPAQQMSMTDMLQFMTTQQNATMSNLAQLLAALRPASTGNSDMLTTIKSMRELQGLASDLVPSKDGDSGGDFASIARAVSPFAPVIAEIIKQRSVAPTMAALPNPNLNPTAQPTPTLNPAPVAVPVSQPEPAVDPAQDADMINQLREQLGALADIAKDKPDPKEIVAQLLPALPEAFDEQIYDTLAADNWFERLSFIQPKIREHKEWFATLRTELLASFEEQSVDPNRPAS